MVFYLFRLRVGAAVWGRGIGLGRYSNRAYHFHKRWMQRRFFTAMRDRFFEIKAEQNQAR